MRQFLYHIRIVANTPRDGKLAKGAFGLSTASIALTPQRAVFTLAPQGIGAIAQLGERYNGIVEVGGSIPPGSTNFPTSIENAVH